MSNASKRLRQDEGLKQVLWEACGGTTLDRTSLASQILLDENGYCPYCQQPVNDKNKTTTLCIECNNWVHLDCFDAEHDICRSCCLIGSDENRPG